jgi:hypothetical protein
MYHVFLEGVLAQGMPSKLGEIEKRKYELIYR